MVPRCGVRGYVWYVYAQQSPACAQHACVRRRVDKCNTCTCKHGSTVSLVRDTCGGPLHCRMVPPGCYIPNDVEPFDNMFRSFTRPIGRPLTGLQIGGCRCGCGLYHYVVRPSDRHMYACHRSVRRVTGYQTTPYQHSADRRTRLCRLPRHAWSWYALLTPVRTPTPHVGSPH